MNNRSSLPPNEPLHGYISQAGFIKPSERISIFQEALRLRNTPPLYSQEGVTEKQVSVKFFDPCGSWTWYAVEWDGKDRCFGYVIGLASEWGDFSLHELAYDGGRMGVGIEVDEWFTPQPVPEIKLSKTPKSKGQELER